MDLRQSYKIERIVREIVERNTDKSLDEIKRRVKQELRRREERGELEQGMASSIGREQIIDIITTHKSLAINCKNESSAITAKQNEEKGIVER